VLSDRCRLFYVYDGALCHVASDQRGVEDETISKTIRSELLHLDLRVHVSQSVLSKKQLFVISWKVPSSAT
jgi:hypothetical protein